MQLALAIPSRIKLALLALGLVMALAVAGSTAPPAHAAGCVTLGHAYYIKTSTGFNYMSGFEGDVRYGIPLVEVRRGETFQLGGNGIKPGTPIRFYSATGFMGQFNNQSFFTTNAGGNCVVDQTRNNGFIGNVPNGIYRVRADYQVPSRSIVGDPVVDLKVVG